MTELPPPPAWLWAFLVIAIASMALIDLARAYG
jgi:hypothetical protein